MEQELLAVLADALRIDIAELASHSFTDLVGDSLAALEVSDRVFEELGVRIDLGLVYRSDSVAAAVNALVAGGAAHG